ncbi:hypothetical protein TRFO_41828 [Tritrichomonas foetus]|uniref:Uncharacterized protein n=1 Tax=Tritrichomonas foetus TaxID=1144522 RepID=A0A1J4KYL4_9EUKA|nr:hypothetical protein TRFO_41828 [Tritrichomonas foetus]|eukprot:OHT16353.1 hypothetical protein TRFO_41828 [Tritrichomonas foetus]
MLTILYLLIGLSAAKSSVKVHSHKSKNLNDEELKVTAQSAMRAYALVHQLQSRNQTLSEKQMKMINKSTILYQQYEFKINQTINDLLVESKSAEEMVNEYENLSIINQSDFKLYQKAKNTLFKNFIKLINCNQKLSFVYSGTKSSKYNSTMREIQDKCKNVSLQIATDYMVLVQTENHSLIPNIIFKCKTIHKILGRSNITAINELTQEAQGVMENVENFKPTKVTPKLLKEYILKAKVISKKKEFTLIEKSQLLRCLSLLKQESTKIDQKIIKLETQMEESNITSNQALLLKSYNRKSVLLTWQIQIGKSLLNVTNFEKQQSELQDKLLQLKKIVDSKLDATGKSHQKIQRKRKSLTKVTPELNQTKSIEFAQPEKTQKKKVKFLIKKHQNQPQIKLQKTTLDGEKVEDSKNSTKLKEMKKKWEQNLQEIKDDLNSIMKIINRQQQIQEQTHQILQKSDFIGELNEKLNITYRKIEEMVSSLQAL